MRRIGVHIFLTNIRRKSGQKKGNDKDIGSRSNEN